MPPGHVRRPPPLERAIDPIQSRAPHSTAVADFFAKQIMSPDVLSHECKAAPEPTFSDDLHSFIDEIASQVSQHSAAGVTRAASEGGDSRTDGPITGAVNNTRKISGLDRLLEPLIKNSPSKSQPLAGLVLPPAPNVTTTHLALRNISGAYLIDAPCASQPSPHFSISKSPLRSPRSLSPLAKTVERLSHSSTLSDAAVAAASKVALPAMLQQPIDEIRRAAAACEIDVQSAIDRLQSAMTCTIVEALVARGSKRGEKTRPSKPRDGSKAIERSEAARMAMEDFEDFHQGHILPQIPAPAKPPFPRPTTSSSQLSTTPRSFDEGFGVAYQLPLQSLKLSSSSQQPSREAAAEVAYKKRMAGKTSSQLTHNSIASMMSASGMFDDAAAIWPSAALDSWPSKSTSRVVTSVGEENIAFLHREDTIGDAVDASAPSPSQAHSGKVEALRHCSRRPVPQLLQKLETDLDTALVAKGLPAHVSKSPASDSADPSQQAPLRTLRASIFLNALALVGAAFPTYRALIMRIHGELAASLAWLDAHTKEMMLISEKFHLIQQIHADDLRRERERVLASAAADSDPSRNRSQISAKQQREMALALQASNSEFIAQRRVKELEKQLETASDTIARLQEAVLYLRQQADKHSAAELQQQHAKVIAHLRSIIKESVHRDDHNLLKQQLVQLQMENAQLLGHLSAESTVASRADVSSALLSQKNSSKVSKKNFGTQTFAESSYGSGMYSLLEIKEMILGIMPGLRGEIDAIMRKFYGDEYGSSPAPTPSAPKGTSPTATPLGSGASSPVRVANMSFGSMAGASGGSDSAGLQQMFSVLKQSVDQLMLNANRSSSPESPGDQDAKRTKSRAGARNLKSRGQHSEEERADVTVSERELFAFFQTNGTGKNVPVHLRTNIKLVKNRFFSKRECENMVHQVWKAKDKQKNSGPLDKFILSFFIQQYGEEMVVMECSYSLVYALKKFKYDPDCDLFLGCLEKLLPQDLRSVQTVITNDVMASCRKRDLRIHKETLGFLSLEELLRALKDVKIFLYKSDEAFLALQDALALEAEDTAKINYEHLFESDAAGDQCKFAEAVREQSLFEYNELIADLQKSMILLCSSSGRLTLSKEEMMAQQARHDECGDGIAQDGSLSLITMEMALSSWSAVDCRVPPKFAESIMLNVFQSKTGQKFPRTPLPVFEVIQELRKIQAHVMQVYITRYSKRDQSLAAAPFQAVLPSISDIKSIFVKERSADES